MAELVAVGAAAGVAAAYFAGIQAFASITSTYQSYRLNHPKGRQSDRNQSDYVKQHFGHDIKLPNGSELKCEGYMDLLPQVPKQRRRDTIKRKLSIKRIRNSVRRHTSNTPRPRLLRGEIKLTQTQKVPDTFADNFVGVNTGKQPMYNTSKATKHWASIQDGTACERNAPPTIAVVNWTSQLITMFTKNSEWEKGMYFRNYQVQNCNLVHFAEEFRRLVVFTGIVRGATLTAGTNSPILLVEDDRRLKVKSGNSWQKLGLSGDTGGEFMFLEMNRAVLFGLVECLYEDPTLVNVDIRDGGDGSGIEFVLVDIPGHDSIKYKPDCFFSVFAFNASEYSKERVLVG